MMTTRHQVAFVKKNEKGEITTWKGDSKDGQLLKMLVENGMLDNLKPMAIRNNYPQFMKYSAVTFRSALTNARKSYNNDLYRRSSRGGMLLPQIILLIIMLTFCIVTTVVVIPKIPGPGMTGVNKFNVDDDNDDDDDDSDYEDDGEEDTFADGQSTIKTIGFKSVAFLDRKFNGKVKRNDAALASFQHGTKLITLPYIVDVWLGNNAQKHVSIQMQLLTGDSSKVTARVSSDQKALVIEFPMTKYLSSSSYAFVPYVIAQEQHKKDEKAKEHCKVALNVHPKTFARQKSVSIINNRNPSKVIMYEQRIPLPFACLHDFSTTVQDQYFHGETKVHYGDGSVHLHVELVADIRDSYVAEAESLVASLHVSDYHVAEDVKVPGNILVSNSKKHHHQSMDYESISSFNLDSETLKSRQAATIKSAAASRRSLPLKNKRLALTTNDGTVA